MMSHGGRWIEGDKNDFMCRNRSPLDVSHRIWEANLWGEEDLKT